MALRSVAPKACRAYSNMSGDNLTIVMRLAGTKSVKEITRDYIAPPAIA
jgi:isopentenyl diphosphate isomerase/L-lactate dehydrogenase-like FMN-dependent dehydrogenase